ncbi:SymE family type I addiction module toxin [Scandinavium lactucae]|uniref:SymE family type I addiction module toxin n=1 Tax=Scandinavium lactucae TaxID=3095028 RepID=A0ABU4QKF8_9ENTR|nr:MULTISPECIES: SymE family type I addiction module toxin [unclassified Scandinavium]MDX6038708.1 SymE family type I addiction module toxin [Scandinavium sp. V105_6]MDX6049336.1 SymE family type I addiction module toxin [Scandinavium sp. V105_1]
MVNTNNIEECMKAVVFPSTLHSYTVSYGSNYPKHDRLPAIMLRGQWLAKAGFEPGRKLEARMIDECNFITAKNLQPMLEDTIIPKIFVIKLKAIRNKTAQENFNSQVPFKKAICILLFDM